MNKNHFIKFTSSNSKDPWQTLKHAEPQTIVCQGEGVAP